MVLVWILNCYWGLLCKMRKNNQHFFFQKNRCVNFSFRKIKDCEKPMEMNSIVFGLIDFMKNRNDFVAGNFSWKFRLTNFVRDVV